MSLLFSVAIEAIAAIAAMAAMAAMAGELIKQMLKIK